MKLTPPVLNISSKEPFAEALYDRKQLGESLTSLLSNVTDPTVVFIHAPWGEGKTTFGRMWLASLRNDNRTAIYFDAYATDYCIDPFVSFSAEILRVAKEQLGGVANAKLFSENFRHAAIVVGKGAVGIGLKLAIRAISGGILDSTDFTEPGKEAMKEGSDFVAKLIEDRIDQYNVEKDALVSFKESLGKLAALVRATQEFPLTIVVDELDRCRPDYALGLLERIKHLFDVPGVVFLLLVNRDQIEAYIRTVYGQSVDARGYLLKFAHLFVDLPVRSDVMRHQKGRIEYCHALFEHHNVRLRRSEGDVTIRTMVSLAEHFELSLREIERVFTILDIYYAALPAHQFTNGFLVALLAVIKVKHPAIYLNLRRGAITVQDFFVATRLDTFQELKHAGVPADYVAASIKFYLFTDDQFAVEPDNSRVRHMGKGLMDSGLDREAVIPFLCARLDQFGLKPRTA